MYLLTKLSKSREPGTPFGARLRRLRVACGFTQKQLADMVGMKTTALSRLEWSPDANPTLDTLQTLATALKVTIIDLVTDNPTPSKN